MGGPGSGKSLVASIFAELGCRVIDADRLAREAIEDAEVKERLRDWWGTDVIDDDGRVNRKRVGEIVFADSRAKAQLEQLIHPRVHAERARLRALATQDSDVQAVVEDCPLLLEVGLDRDCDVLIFVDAPLSLRQERVAAGRGWSAEELSRRDASQLPLDSKRDRADYILINDADPDHARVQSSRVLSLILKQHADR